jgi:hypothetical protein
VVISKDDGVVYKRIGNKFKDNKKLKLISDNPVYEPYEINGEDVLEIWKAKGYISTQLPQPTPEPTMESLTSYDGPDATLYIQFTAKQQLSYIGFLKPLRYIFIIRLKT